MKIRERIKSEFDNSCMVSSFMPYKILVRKRLNYIIFAPIIIEGQKIVRLGFGWVDVGVKDYTDDGIGARFLAARGGLAYLYARSKVLRHHAYYAIGRQVIASGITYKKR